MNLDDFENKFRETDPAASMTPAEAHHHDHMIERAMSADTSHIAPVSRWTTRRKAASSAAAVLLLGGLLAPTISGSMVAGGPERLVFTQSARGAMNESAGGDQKMGANVMMPYWYTNTHYVVDGTLSDATSTGSGYEVVTRSDAEVIIKNVAKSLGLADLSYNTSSKGWVLSDDPAALVQFFGADSRAGNTGGSFSYYNQKLDPYFDCYRQYQSQGKTVVEPADECIPPLPKNLPTNDEAKKLAADYLAAWGLNEGDFKFEVFSGDGTQRYSVNVYATLLVDGYASPISYNFTFVDNGDVQSAYGSLLELKSLGVYDLIAPSAVITRLEDMNAAQKTAYDKWVANNGVPTPATDTATATTATDAPSPVATASSGSSSGSSGSGATSAPVDPSAGPVDPMPTPMELVLHVTRVERTMVTAYLADQRMVWLPGFEIWGWQEGDNLKNVYQMNSVVGIVDSQIDLNSLYSWGPMVAMDGIAVR